MIKSKRLDALLANLGYASRGEVKRFLKIHTVLNGGERICEPSKKVFHNNITIDGEPLDPESITILLHKPLGVVCSHDDSGKLIYSLLPLRWQRRLPKLSTIGRLDQDTTGAILISDDGELNHRLTSPKSEIAKLYRVELAHPLRGDEKEIFKSGTLMLHGESKPLLGAKMEQIEEKVITLEIVEGRYHQIKRMVGAVGNRVVGLHRISFGEWDVSDLGVGEYKVIL